MLVSKYIIFAIISTIFNLFFQYLSFKFYQGVAALYLAMSVGTVVGLIVKYILDKKFIFYHEIKDKKEDAKKFALYSFMGIFTTFIFWGTEIFIDNILKEEYAKYLGGLLGLSIGYVIKYFLDKKYVFVHKEESLI